MKIGKNILTLYCAVVAVFILASAPFPFQLIFLPPAFFFLWRILALIKHLPELPGKKLFIYYCFLIFTIMAFVGFLGSKNIPQLFSAALFFPLTIYFWVQIVPRKNKALVLPKKIPISPPILQPLLEPTSHRNTKFDNQRRTFIKLIGSAGLGLFVFSLFAKKAEAAFFGSVPGPGTVAVKDASGTLIDPSKHHPTDGYKITQIDDSGPNFYGFLNKDGAWFIMKEDTNGDYRYTKGSSDFSNATTGWPNRANLTYNYFDVIF